MTLRQWYAGQALAGLMATDATNPDIGAWSDMADACFAMADAMIQAEAKDADS